MVVDIGGVCYLLDYELEVDENQDDYCFLFYSTNIYFSSLALIKNFLCELEIIFKDCF